MENEGIRETLIRKLEICIFSLEQERFHCHYPFYDSKEIKEIQRNLGIEGALQSSLYEIELPRHDCNSQKMLDSKSMSIITALMLNLIIFFLMPL